ncbi:unnamed protein product [Dibothriocephalus latus]|uniref:c-SKI SMAD4-binding domain-containing protein n=1 Tax=Dibothriocephalus latus TaxID=60516 RepID=A0A3P7L398_DIBLA|nr:unnamed protein product [Dibothriocephalus latus]
MGLQIYFSPNKFVFHCHTREETGRQQASAYRHPDAANFNAWRRHLVLTDPTPPEELLFAWEDVKAMFNGGNRKKASSSSSSACSSSEVSMTYPPETSPPPPPLSSQAFKRRCLNVSQASTSARGGLEQQQARFGILASSPEAFTRTDCTFEKYRSVFTSLFEQSPVENHALTSFAAIPNTTTHPPSENTVTLNTTRMSTTTAPVNQPRIRQRDWLANLLVVSMDLETRGSSKAPVGSSMGTWANTLKNYLEMMTRGIYLPPPPPPPPTA